METKSTHFVTPSYKESKSQKKEVLYHTCNIREYSIQTPKLEGCAFANFGNSSGTEGKPNQKGEKEKNQCCRDLESNPGPIDN